MQARFMKKDSLMQWLDTVAKDRRVMAPQRKGKKIAFAAYEPGNELALQGLAAAPPKQVVLPRCEPLLEYRYNKSDDNPPKTDLEVREIIPDQKVLLFGSRPCDAKGFVVFDRVYDAGSKRDIYFCIPRENTVVASLACTDPAETCFCNRVGGSPSSKEGSDLLLTELADGYVIEPVTERGEAFLAQYDIGEAGNRLEEAMKQNAKVLADMPNDESLTAVSQQVLEQFENNELWEELTAKCLSCGTCSYLCPTCYCFNITDEAKGNEGIRIRTWDNCMSFQFTLEGSGHNPRSVKAKRMRNRVGHKFSYYPTLHDGNLSCVGCGRCIQSCPVSMDIRNIVTQASKCPKQVEECAHD